MHKVAIIGAGPIGSAMAAYLVHRGHSVGLWSRSFHCHRQASLSQVKFRTTGMVEGNFVVHRIAELSELDTFDTVIIALPATAYRDVLPSTARYLRSAQTVIFSGALSLAPLWLFEMAQAENQEPTVVAWGTTLLAASFQPSGDLHIPFIRKQFDLAAIPGANTRQGHAVCEDLFDIDFGMSRSILDIGLSNINPVAHAGQLMVNFSRIDKGEHWKLFENFTRSGVRIAEALDADRLRIASAFSATTRSLQRHYALSYKVQEADVYDMARQIDEAGSRTLGPKTMAHRYIVEDMPYGLAFLERLARCAGVEVPTMSAVISLIEVAGHLDIRSGNQILDFVVGPAEDSASLLARCLPS